jgi:hypothetical protein
MISPWKKPQNRSLFTMGQAASPREIAGNEVPNEFAIEKTLPARMPPDFADPKRRVDRLGRGFVIAKQSHIEAVQDFRIDKSLRSRSPPDFV